MTICHLAEPIGEQSARNLDIDPNRGAHLRTVSLLSITLIIQNDTIDTLLIILRFILSPEPSAKQHNKQATMTMP